ncbi:hypothetical protein [Hydrogenophaga sp.]|uniref:hypothetical protein n=1 Tax=Hydrogenophaga sp. TaxID=1904254 RepID=UPI003D09ED21
MPGIPAMLAPLTVPDPAGRNMRWHLYSVEFDSPDGCFMFQIYAISEEHAQLQVQAIRETARLCGRVVAIGRKTS